ncbi:MAG: DUF1566 domain-containing protein [bacterium]|nr:DUF1566 domain-containing protein [bacterium]
MKAFLSLAAAVLVLGAVGATAGEAQVHPVRWGEDQVPPQAVESARPSLVPAGGGIEFPDGSVQTTAARGRRPARVPRTGQTSCYDVLGAIVGCAPWIGLGQDGALQLGVTWPNPRFTKNGDGTVTDNVTRLIWLENAHCAPDPVDWEQALAFANSLADGSTGGQDSSDCGLSDSSVAGQWRLPNVRELQSLVHYGVGLPSVPNTSGIGQWVEGDPFSTVQFSSQYTGYWSSTSSTTSADRAWLVGMRTGNVSQRIKTIGFHVWPVRQNQKQLAPTAFGPPTPSLVLADGGIEFPDGSVQTTAAGRTWRRCGPWRECRAPAPVPRTGQTSCYDVSGAIVGCGTGIGRGQDGALQRGVAWPKPRFVKNGDGTVTDNLTRLIWLENADCAPAPMDWEEALAFSNSLADDSTVGYRESACGLSDGSVAGQWRLPNVRELQSLVHYGVGMPTVPNTAGTGQWVEGDPFSGVRSDAYWTSDSNAASATSSNFTWIVSMRIGGVSNGWKLSRFHVWPVRGGQ